MRRMLLRLLRLTLINLLLTLFGTQSATANQSLKGKSLKVNPFTCFSPDELQALAVFKADCDLTKLNFEAEKAAFNRVPLEPVVSWYQEPGFIISGVFVSFSVGLLLGVFFVK